MGMIGYVYNDPPLSPPSLAPSQPNHHCDAPTPPSLFHDHPSSSQMRPQKVHASN